MKVLALRLPQPWGECGAVARAAGFAMGPAADMMRLFGVTMESSPPANMDTGSRRS